VKKELLKCNYCIISKVHIIATFVNVAIQISDV
jgi:hypothetical protein